MKNNNKTTMEQAREKLMQEKERNEHISFLSDMENKNFSELSLKQQSYLYNKHKNLYLRLKEDKEERIQDLITLENLKEQESARKEQSKKELEEIKGEQNIKLSDREKELKEMIEKAFNNSLKKYDLV